MNRLSGVDPGRGGIANRLTAGAGDARSIVNRPSDAAHVHAAGNTRLEPETIHYER